MSRRLNGPWPGEGLRAKAVAGLFATAMACACVAAHAHGRAKVLWSEAGHAEAVTAMDLSPDGSVLATASEDRTLKLWRYPDGTLLHTLAAADDPLAQVTDVTMARITPDGRFVVAALDRVDNANQAFGTVDVFRVDDGRLVREFGRQDGEMPSIDVSPDGRWVATASQSGVVAIWRFADGKLLEKLPPHPGPATDVRFAPAGDRLAAAYGDFHLVSWRTSDWSVRWDVAAHLDSINRIAYSPDGARIATASTDGTAALFDAKDGALLHTLPEGSGKAVFAAAFSPDGASLATGGVDGAIELWDVAQGTLTRQFTDSGGWIASLRFAADGHSVISGGQFPSRIEEWNPDDGTRLRSLTRLSSLVNRVAFSPDSRWVAIAAGFDQRIDVLRTKDGRRVYSWNTQSEALDVAFSPDGRLAAMPGPGNTVVVRRLSDGQVVHTLTGHAENVTGVAFSHDGTLLVSGSYFPGSIRLWRTSDWSLVREIDGGQDLGAFGPFVSFTFSPDDTLLGTSAEATPVVLRVADGSVVAFPSGVTRAVTFSPDGQLFVVSGGVDQDDGVRIFRTSDWTRVQTLPTGANDAAFSSDGTRLLAAHIDALRIWRTSDWTVLETYDEELGYTGSSLGVQAVGIAPDGSRFVYGRYDATAVTARMP